MKSGLREALRGRGGLGVHHRPEAVAAPEDGGASKVRSRLGRGRPRPNYHASRVAGRGGAEIRKAVSGPPPHWCA